MSPVPGPYVSAFDSRTLTTKTAARADEIDYMFYKPEGKKFKMIHTKSDTYPPQEAMMQDGFMIPHGKGVSLYDGGVNGFPSDHAYLEASFQLVGA